MIARALAKDPEQRFQSAGDLGRAAAAAASGDALRAGTPWWPRGAAAPIEIETRTAGTMLAPPLEAAGAARRRSPPARGRGGGGAAGGGRRGVARARRRPRGAAHAPRAAASASKLESTKVGGRPAVIAGAGGHIWTGRSHRRRLATLDPSTGERNLRLRPRAGLGLRAFAADGRDLWVLASRTGQLVHLDARSGRRIGDARAAARHRQRGGGDRGRRVGRRHAARARPGRPDPRDRPRHGETRAVDRACRDGVRRLVLARGAALAARQQRRRSSSGSIRAHRRDAPCPARRRPRQRPRASARLPVGDALRRRQASRASTSTASSPTSRRAGGPAGIAVRKDVVWVANRTDSTLTPIDARTGSRPAKGIRVS